MRNSGFSLFSIMFHFHFYVILILFITFSLQWLDSCFLQRFFQSICIWNYKIIDLFKAVVLKSLGLSVFGLRYFSFINNFCRLMLNCCLLHFTDFSPFQKVFPIWMRGYVKTVGKVAQGNFLLNKFQFVCFYFRK